MKRLKTLVLFSTMMLVFGALAACGNAPSDASKDNSGGGESVSGSIVIDGSSTVFPIMEALTYQYNQKNPEVDVTVNSSGSGGGFKKFTRGETDLSNASRPIKEEEKQIAKENGIEYKELELAKDGLSVVVSKKNDFVDSLTIEQLQKIFRAESGVTKWSDINPEWPDEPIKIFSPGHDSGTFDYFNEVILEDKPMKEGQNTTLSEDDNMLVRGIKDNPYAIGYFGYAYYAENKDSLKVLGIDNGEGKPVKPTPETIKSGEYTPLSRPLFTYVNLKSLKEKQQVADFVKFTLKNAGEAAEQVGYVALPEEKYQQQLDMIKEITK
ncbi:PstS family phosphate ABC transporter substrate-binding protein [Thalassobacillus pellis]|uniref:PstS family phosphate ABC transporter substrate-binding protein n=1 Tax=Thalassobacillus pellis TaxID=748008 RepID=UPI0019603257|nr:PstS family phosphate ABC transporter substrate-binding protein [Thalassobacillus pellis]MBM7552273.1 phosphate transport system substrate-binding protein [Thalassobacillus pellis]